MVTTSRKHPSDGQPQTARPDPFGLALFDDDCSQPDLSACSAQADSADTEPVFWADGAGQAGPADDFVQADLSACDAQADALESV